MTLIVRGLECQLSTEEVVVGEHVSSKVIEIGDSLWCWIIRQCRRLHVDCVEYLVGIRQLSNVEKHSQTDIGEDIYTVAFVFWLPTTPRSSRTSGPAPVAQTFYESFTHQVCRTFNERGLLGATVVAIVQRLLVRKELGVVFETDGKAGEKIGEVDDGR